LIVHLIYFRADIVCHIPPVSILGTSIAFDYYYHALNEYYLKDVIGNEAKFADQSVYEDRDCSNSLGPLYSPADHFKYFDVNHNECLADFIQEFTAIPGVIFPIEDVPEFPGFIQISINDIGTSLINIVSPLLG